MGSVMCRYLTTNELINDQMNIRAIVDLGSSYADVFCIDLVPINIKMFIVLLNLASGF